MFVIERLPSLDPRLAIEDDPSGDLVAGSVLGGVPLDGKGDCGAIGEFRMSTGDMRRSMARLRPLSHDDFRAPQRLQRRGFRVGGRQDVMAGLSSAAEKLME